MLYLLKILISALVITGASELARRSTGLAALLLALPVVSLLTFTWVWIEQRDPQQIARLSIETFWYVLPTLPLFIVLGMMLRQGFGYVASLAAGCAVGAVLLGVTQWLVAK
jgi:hypothetical protein